MSTMSSAASVETSVRVVPQPISVAERFHSIDVLRGVALCGILVMNIPWFARAESMFFNPTTGGGFEGADYWTWLISHLFFDFKMMTIFSMLFGAGMLVMTDRAAATGRSAAGVYYRRLVWLLLFGLLHAYFLWSGDILYSYALCGMVLYPFRRLRPAWLLTMGIALLFVGIAIISSMGWFMEFARSTAHEAQQVIDAGGAPSEMQKGMIEAWQGLQKEFTPSDERLAREAAAHLGSYGELFVFRAASSLFMQTGLFIMMFFWRAAGVMLLGMALMKWNVFTAARSRAFYLRLMLAGYVIGLPMIAVGVSLSIKTDFDFVASFAYVWTFNYVGSIFVALGHVALIMLLCQHGLLDWLTKGLAAIGRMALTNYLSHSLICSIIFFGWGFGMWGKWSRFETLGVVIAVWVFQFFFSQLWLANFRFGPMEWLWRSLTYWRWQPMRRVTSEVPTPLGAA